MKPILYGRQDISEDDIRAVVEVLHSDWLTQGPAIGHFEQAIADYCGAQYAVAVCNGTAALHLACLAAGLGSGDLLWTSPNTFVASANCGRYCGAEVDFVDIDPDTLNLSPSALQQKLERSKTPPKALIPVHFAGQPCDMAEIGELARQRGIAVIEDAAHALGASYRGDRIGSCAHSDMTVFSFHPVKSITTGEGGMILTNRKDLYQRLQRLRSHGITRNPAEMADPGQGAWYYEQTELGFNYRITDIQAALGMSQLKRLDEFVGRRRQLAARYAERLAGLKLVLPEVAADRDSAHHLYPIQVGLDNDRRHVFDALRAAGILANVHYIPVHLHPYYRRLGFTEGDFPAAEAYYRQAISLPLHQQLSEPEQDRVVAVLQELLQ
jgi:UDP-4-amino-4,6-dideoxy-N-acetyl-beta-L-altrosamine transaminase